MSAIDAFGLATHLLLLSAFKTDNESLVKEYRAITTQCCRRYGITTGLVLLTLFAPDALQLIDRVERSVLVVHSDPRGVAVFVNSLTSNLGMIGVAGAIIAQIATTAISIDDPNNLSWTTNACFVVGTVCGGLSVVLACLAHSAIRGLASTEHIKSWLAQPSRLNTDNQHEDDKEQRRYASAYAVMILLAPSRLLNIALSFLLIGFGIQLGLLYTDKVALNISRSGLLATLIIYVCAAALGLASYFVPESMKAVESRELRMREAQRIGHHRRRRRHPQSPSLSSSQLDHGGEPLSSHIELRRHPTRGAANRYNGDHESDHVPLTRSMPAPGTLQSLGGYRGGDGSDRSATHSDVEIQTRPTMRQDTLEGILRELVAVQTQCRNISERLLLEHHQQHNLPR